MMPSTLHCPCHLLDRAEDGRASCHGKDGDHGRPESSLHGCTAPPDPTAGSQPLHKYLPSCFLNKPETPQGLKSKSQTAPVLLLLVLRSPAACTGILQAPDPLILKTLQSGRQAPAWSGSRASSNTSASDFIRDIQAG